MAALAKISRPKLHRAFPRTRLFRRLDEARERALTWVSAPPGAGKTVLVASHLRARKLPGVWYQVDPDDKDPATFFHYLSWAAPRRRKPLPPLTPEYLPDLPGFARRYFRDLFIRLPQPSALVFDNYQEAAEASPLNTILREALNEMPDELRMIVISRSELPRELARLQANEAVTRVDWEELRLTLDEAAGIARLREITDDELIRRLYEDADGWAAGFILEIEQLHRSGMKRGLSGADTRQTVFNYFAAEIFDRSPFEHRRLLAQTAFPQHLSAAAAIELTGDQEASKLLEGLYRRHLFTDRRGGPDGVYHYHALFRGFLLEQARANFTTEERAQIAKRAARISEARGETENALALYCDAQDWASAMRLIVAAAPTLLAQGRNQLLQAWIGAIPREHQSPGLLYWLGLAVMPFSQPESRRHLEAAFRPLKSNGDTLGTLLACVALIDSYFFEWGNMVSMDQWIAELEELLAAKPRYPSNEIEAQVISSGMGMLWRQLGHPLLTAWRDRALELLQSDLHPRQRLALGAKVILLCLWRGDFAIGSQLIAEQAAAAKRIEPGLELLLWRVMLTQYHYPLGEFETAHKQLKLAWGIAAETGIHVLDKPLHVQGAYLGVISGDSSMAESSLRSMKSVLQMEQPLDVSAYHFICAAIALREGHLQQALQLQQRTLDLNIAAGSPYPIALTHFGLGQVLTEMGQHDRALEHLHAGREIGLASRSSCLVHTGLMFEACSRLQTGEDDQALELLRAGLSLGREFACAGTTLWWSPKIKARLCARALEAGIEVDTVQKLIRRHKVVPESPDIEHWPWPIRVYTLGQFAIMRAGETVVFTHKTPKKPIALLKAIIAMGGREVPEGLLVDALWPGEEGDAAYDALTTNLYRLRKLLVDSEAVQMHDGRISLNARRCWVDAEAFERLLGRADAAQTSDSQEQTSMRAMALYRGPFLAAEIEESWTLSMRERLRGKFIRHSALRAHRREQAGAWEEALDCYRRGLEADDLAEEFYQGSMRCLGKLDRCAEGLAVYRRLRQTISVTLGIDPSPASQALYEWLRGDQR